MTLAVRQLREVCAITMGQAPDGETYNDEGKGLPLIAGAGDFGPDRPAPKKYTTVPTKICDPGDIVISIRATIGTKVWSNGRFCLGRGVSGLRPTPELNVHYLWHWLGTAEKELASKGRGATFPQVSRADIGDLEIPLPPLDEQRRIAAILDKADALRRKRKRALDLLDRLTQSIFLDMFVTHADAAWPIATVDALSKDMRTGPFGSQLLHSEFTENGVCVLGIDNAVTNEFVWGERRYISAQKYQTLRRYTVKPRDVLITIMGTCGRCVVVPDQIQQSINTKHLCCLTLDEEICQPHFLQAAFLQHPSILKQLGVQAKGAVMPGLNMGIIKSLEVAVPPIKLQDRFVTRNSVVTEARRTLRKAVLADEALFKSLQSRAFTDHL